jgi:hypothetical protein
MKILKDFAFTFWYLYYFLKNLPYMVYLFICSELEIIKQTIKYFKGGGSR